MRTELVVKVKLMAKLHKLYSVDFLDRNGKICKNSGFSKVKMIFTSGEEFILTAQEFSSFGEFEFTLGQIGDA